MKKDIRRKIETITGIVFILYFIVLRCTMGRIAFSKYLLFGGIVLCFLPVIDKKLEKNKLYKKLMHIIRVVFVAGMIVFAVTEAFIIYYGTIQEYDRSDYTIVLGAGLRGEKMSVTLKQRVDEALKYMKKGNNTGFIVVSGGQGKGELIPESEAMKRYLVKCGIGEDRIIQDDKSTSTYENLAFSKKLIEQHSGKPIDKLNIKIVTSGFHVLRSRLTCYKLGMKNVTLLASPIRLIFIPTYYIREFLSFYNFLIFDFIS